MRELPEAEGLDAMRPTATRRSCPHPRVYLALLPSGPDAVRRLKLTRDRAAVRRIP